MPFLESGSSLNHGLPDHILALWDRLAHQSHPGDPACAAPAWNLAYQDAFHCRRRIFYETDGDNLVVFGEYHSPDGELYLLPMEDGWMFGQPLLGPFASRLLACVLEKLNAHYAPRIPTLVISGIRPESPLAWMLFRFHSEHYNFYLHSASVQVSASLKDGPDGWLKRRSANHRAKLKKASRKVKEAGIVFERCRPQTMDEADAAYARMLRVERRSWKGIQHCGMAEAGSREFYEALMRRLVPQKRALVIFARRDSSDLGFIFGCLSREIYRGQQFSYVEKAAPLSLGNVMQWEKILWLSELGAARYDMGPGTGPKMEYKSHWTEEQREIQTWIMHRER